MTNTPYTTIELVEAYLKEDIEPAFVSSMERWILGVSLSMDVLANRKLVADEYDSDEQFELRYFDVTKYGYVTIDDCMEIESVESKNNDIWEEVTTDAYPTLPPFRKVIYGFPVGLQNVRIRARWGYMEEITADLEWAATVIAAGVYIAKKTADGTSSGQVAREKIGNYEISYANSGTDGKSIGFMDLGEAKTIVSNYRKILI